MPCTPCIPLLAAGLDWLEGLLPLLFVLFWIVSQVWGVFRKAAGDNGRNAERNAERGGRPVANERPRPVPPRRAREIRDEARRVDEILLADDRDQVVDRPLLAEREQLTRQIEEFLRETSGGQPARQRQQPPPALPARTSPPPLPSKPPVRERRRRSAEVSTGTGATGRQPTLRETPTAFHEMPHLADAFAARTATAPASSKASPTLPTPPSAATPTAAELALLFRDPATLRQLILVREVLDRPVGRW